MKEQEIRPLDIFDEYLKLTKEDVKIYFSNVKRTEIKCPACLSKGNFSFEKEGFCYEECPKCFSLYVSPRPSWESFSRYYTESESTKYWATTFYKKTADARKEKLWKPKAKSIIELLKKYKCEGSTIIDIGGGYGLFAESLREIYNGKIMIIEPSPSLSKICREKEFDVVEKFLEDIEIGDLPSGPKVFVSFELFEHLHSPESFLQSLKKTMKSGDLFVLTTLSSAGIDIRTLWENSKSVSPPHHLNFLNPYSMKLLLERMGFEFIEATTPGKLDLDIMNNSKQLLKDSFWKIYLDNATEEQKNKMQVTISEQGFSSHMMAVSRLV